MVDADGRAVRVDRQLLGACWETQRRGVERRVGLDHLGRIEGPVIGHDVARVGRLVSKATGCVDGAQHAHQHRQSAHGLKAVGMRRQTAHGVESQRTRLRGRVQLAPGIGPRNRQLERLLQSRVAHLLRERHDTLGGDAGNRGCPLWRAGGYALAQQLKGRGYPRAVGQGVVAF